MRLRRGVRVSERLVGDQQMPRDRLQVGGVAVKHAVRRQHHPGPVAELAIEAADLSGNLPVICKDEQLEIRRERWEPAAGCAPGEFVMPLGEQSALGDDEASQPRLRGRAVGERAAGGDRLAGSDGGGVDAGADDLQRRGLALAAEQHRVIGQRSRGGHAHELAGAGRQGHRGLRAFERDQRADRLLGHHPPGARGHPVGARDREHPRPAFHPPDADGVLQFPRCLGGQQQRQPGIDGGLHRLAQVHYRAGLRSELVTRRRAQSPLREPAGGECDDAELEFGCPAAVPRFVRPAADCQAAPPVARVARHAWTEWGAELARELLRELAGGVQALLRAGVQGAVVDPLEQLDRARRSASRPSRRSRSSRPRSSAPRRIISSESAGDQLPSVARP